MEKYKDAKFSLEERASDLVSRLTLDEKIGLLCTHQLPVERLSIGEWYIGAEVARGYVSRDPKEPTTVFPQPIGMAGMFDTELMFRLGEIAGEEARILHKRHPNGHLMLWGPTVDMCRDPRWGRNEEGYGEDPYLTGQMSAAYTNGLAGKKDGYMRTIPTLKHFCANNMEEGRGSADSNIEPRTLHEYYYAAFKPAICEGGAYSVMAAYNELSGMPCIVDPDLEGLLKKQWGLGFVVTDGGDFSQNVTEHKYSSSHAETLALALKCGTDIMTDDPVLVAAAAREALEKGLMTEADLDKSVYNTLLARFRLGEFDEKHPYSDVDETRMDCAEFRETNLLAAKKQIVLLKKDGLLPLEKNKKIAVIGINGDANLMDWYTGWSSYNISIFAGLKEKFADVSFDNGCDIVAIRSKLTGKYLGADGEGNLSAAYERSDKAAAFEKSEYGHNEVTFKNVSLGKYFTAERFRADSEGTYRWFSQEIVKPESVGGFTEYKTYFGGVIEADGDGRLHGGRSFGAADGKLFSEEVISSGIERARELAAKADAVIVCVGNDPMVVAREMYDRKTLELPEHQKRLVRAAFEANPNTVMTVVSSYPYSVCEEQEYLPGILYTTHAGPELGNAFAAVVSGEYAPAGRLAQTWYTGEHELAPISDYDIIENEMTYLYYRGRPLYPFGHGLSYAEFEYSDLAVTESGDNITVSLNVKNISDTDGEEVAQIYFSPLAPRVKRPIKQLCAFSRKEIKAGETAALTFVIEKRRLEFYDVTREKFCVESGEYRFFAGASSGDIRCEQTVFVNGETIPPRDVSKPTKAINYDRKYKPKMKYHKTGQFHYIKGGVLFFDKCGLSGEDRVRIEAGSVYGAVKITVKAKTAEMTEPMTLAEIEVPPSVDTERFSVITAEITPIDGIADIEFALPEPAVLKSFEFFKKD